MDSTIVISDSSAEESSVLIIEESSKLNGTKNPSRTNLDGTINISSDSEDENEVGQVKKLSETINISSDSEPEDTIDKQLSLPALEKEAKVPDSEEHEVTINEGNLGTSNNLHHVEDAFSSFNYSQMDNSSFDESRTTVSELNSTSFVESSINYTTESSINSTFAESTLNSSDNIANQSSLILSGSSYVDELECSDVSSSFSLTNNSIDSSTVVNVDSSETHSRSSCDDDVDHDQAKLLHHQPVSVKDLPETCTVLTSDRTGGKLYLVGTAHFSKESQEDVARVIRATQPDVVVLELCKARINILRIDEDSLLIAAQSLTMNKIIATIRQSGVVQGTMYLFLLYFSEKLTKELGMAPGGEFRRAYHEAKKVPGCVVQLGDRPIHVTLKRAFSSLSLWQKVKFGFSIITYKDTITPEEVEQCKQKGLLESMLLDMAGEFPDLSRVFVTERDLFLANTLRETVDARIHFLQGHFARPNSADGPPVVVGVVGIGHVAGIVENWDKTNPQDLAKLMQIPEKSLVEKAALSTLRVSILCLSVYALYRVIRVPVGFIKTKLFL